MAGLNIAQDLLNLPEIDVSLDAAEESASDAANTPQSDTSEDSEESEDFSPQRNDGYDVRASPAFSPPSHDGYQAIPSEEEAQDTPGYSPQQPREELEMPVWPNNVWRCPSSGIVYHFSEEHGTWIQNPETNDEAHTSHCQ
jgi:hypothetical protein